MARRRRPTKLPSPYLRSVRVIPDRLTRDAGYPFDLPWLRDEDFTLDFTTPVTIFVGENGAGKSTLIEALAALAGYDEAGGGKGYRPVDHSRALDRSGSALAEALGAVWLPKVTEGWFFRAETMFSVARYLDEVAIDGGGPPPDYLSASHGEGFLAVFEGRMAEQGLYFLDEPESALSPRRQVDCLRLLHRIHVDASAQVILATHSPILMACPGARLLEITRFGIAETQVERTDHFNLYAQFLRDPVGFAQDAVDGLL